MYWQGKRASWAALCRLAERCVVVDMMLERSEWFIFELHVCSGCRRPRSRIAGDLNMSGGAASSCRASTGMYVARILGRNDLDLCLVGQIHKPASRFLLIFLDKKMTHVSELK